MRLYHLAGPAPQVISVHRDLDAAVEKYEGFRQGFVDELSNRVSNTENKIPAKTFYLMSKAGSVILPTEFPDKIKSSYLELQASLQDTIPEWDELTNWTALTTTQLTPREREVLVDMPIITDGWVLPYIAQRNTNTVRGKRGHFGHLNVHGRR